MAENNHDSFPTAIEAAQVAPQESPLDGRAGVGKFIESLSRLAADAAAHSQEPGFQGRFDAAVAGCKEGFDAVRAPYVQDLLAYGVVDPNVLVEGVAFPDSASDVAYGVVDPNDLVEDAGTPSGGMDVAHTIPDPNVLREDVSSAPANTMDVAHTIPDPNVLEEAVSAVPADMAA